MIWISASDRTAFGTSNLVHAGNDEDGSKIYVGKPGTKIGSSQQMLFQVLSGVGFQWIHSPDGNLPRGAVNVSDEARGDVFYVGRKKFKESLLIGRICIERKRISVPIDKREIDYELYDVLCESQKAQWYPVDEKMVKPIRVGLLEDEFIEYIGRVIYKGEQTTAKVFPSERTAYAPFNGKEVAVSYTDCEILCNGNVRWVYSCHGHVLPNAVEGGKTLAGETFYIGRGCRFQRYFVQVS